MRSRPGKKIASVGRYSPKKFESSAGRDGTSRTGVTPSQWSDPCLHTAPSCTASEAASEELSTKRPLYHQYLLLHSIDHQPRPEVEVLLPLEHRIMLQGLPSMHRAHPPTPRTTCLVPQAKYPHRNLRHLSSAVPHSQAHSCQPLSNSNPKSKTLSTEPSPAW